VSTLDGFLMSPDRGGAAVRSTCSTSTGQADLKGAGTAAPHGGGGATAAHGPGLDSSHTALLSPALMETLLRRGNQMLALGDFASARRLFGRVAQEGDVNAMLALSRLYDPSSFDR
jgi:hypothetical protein